MIQLSLPKLGSLLGQVDDSIGNNLARWAAPPKPMAHFWCLRQSRAVGDAPSPFDTTVVCLLGVSMLFLPNFGVLSWDDANKGVS